MVRRQILDERVGKAAHLRAQAVDQQQRRASPRIAPHVAIMDALARDGDELARRGRGGFHAPRGDACEQRKPADDRSGADRNRERRPHDAFLPSSFQ